MSEYASLRQQLLTAWHCEERTIRQFIRCADRIIATKDNDIASLKAENERFVSDEDEPDVSDGYAHEGFPGGCERMRCPDYVALKAENERLRELVELAAEHLSECGSYGHASSLTEAIGDSHE